MRDELHCEQPDMSGVRWWRADQILQRDMHRHLAGSEQLRVVRACLRPEAELPERPLLPSGHDLVRRGLQANVAMRVTAGALPFPPPPPPGRGAFFPLMSV